VAVTEQPVRAPGLEWFGLEPARATVELYALAVSWPILGLVPAGDGHPVLVLPGFAVSDVATELHRCILQHLGYRVHGWRLGLNVGPTRPIFNGMQERLLELQARYGTRVSVVGQSLGGVYARYLARRHPDAVRQVITLGSPYRLRPGDRSSLSSLQERGASGLATPTYLPDSYRAEEDRPPLTVPATSIYTRTDGVVRWPLCIDGPGPRRENIEISGSHSGLIHHPAAVLAVADRLAQPADRWTPFAPPSLAAHLFPAPTWWQPRAGRTR
jgi:pimeloyl-ACP methyl ester carboxylesterase